MQTVKMYGPAIDGSGRIVNRDVPVADEQAYVRAGYKRGSIPEVVEASQPEPTQPKEVKPRKGVSK